ncbi:AraC family transcriptional regulator [Streptomyces sp. DSM 44917]|uniref:AraC family transcriptional regulator n=1 Tax=Streptomyces boetiae TaxID=3075541 RepID=A0ABU2LCR0_9ACTN|nr:AraC family transcriptional regulator [Streptomyces sp. DSM 44917]MDT0309043.1 AraC family transcriptional regulator [Streptomyces sp. DSM 44917]
MDVLSDAVAAMRTGRPHSARRRLPAPWRLRARPFEGAGFHVVLQGEAWLFPGTPPHPEPLRLGVGDVLLLPHGGAHELTDAPGSPAAETLTTCLAGSVGPEDAEGPGTVLLCGAFPLDRARPHPLLAELPEVIHLPARVGRHGSLRAAVDLLGGELAGPPLPGADGAVPALLETLLLYILRAWYDELAEQRPGSGWAAALHDPGVSAALRAIHREPARPWTVRTLGDEAGLSRAPFARRFAGLVGRPPLTYLTWWRMTLAARLLRTTTHTLRVVAEQVGYTSEFAFAKAFKREHGTTPGRFRVAPAAPGPHPEAAARRTPAPALPAAAVPAPAGAGTGAPPRTVMAPVPGAGPSPASAVLPAMPQEALPG